MEQILRSPLAGLRLSVVWSIILDDAEIIILLSIKFTTENDELIPSKVEASIDRTAFSTKNNPLGFGSLFRGKNEKLQIPLYC